MPRAGRLQDRPEPVTDVRRERAPQGEEHKGGA